MYFEQIIIHVLATRVKMEQHVPIYQMNTFAHVVVAGQEKIVTLVGYKAHKRTSKIPQGQTEIVKSEDRQDHGQKNETKNKHTTHNTTLKTKAGLTRT